MQMDLSNLSVAMPGQKQKPIQIVDLRKEELRDEDIDSGDDSFSPRYIVDLLSTFAKIEEKRSNF